MHTVASIERDPAYRVEAHEAVSHLKCHGFERVLKAIADTMTTSGRVNRLAAARELGVSVRAINRALDEMRALMPD